MNIKTTRTSFLLLILLQAITLSAQTNAHLRSAFARIDPAYDAYGYSPASQTNEDAPGWIYGPAELECWRLQVLRERTSQAKLIVGYPGSFHTPYASVSYRIHLTSPVQADSLVFRTVGKGTVFANDKRMATIEASNALTALSLPRGLVYNLRFDLSTAAEPPALLIESGPFATTKGQWEWKTADNDWQPAYHHPQNVQNVPPHRLEYTTTRLKPVEKAGNLFDFGRELFGYITIRSSTKPKITVGESTYEALDTLNHVLEQSTEMIQIAEGSWASKSPLAFRYVYAEDVAQNDIFCEAIFHPATYQGAFACSDTTLTRIWMHSAYTLRLCMHDFILDGIKRDRLPWTGDLAMSMMANAYTFRDPEIVRRSLVALGRAGIEETDINGIIDYSLWWIISQDHYQLYFGDSTHLQYAWSQIKENLEILSTRCDTAGFLVPKETWLFIDWVDEEKWTALQMLWWWAQKSGARLAERVGDTVTMKHWENKAEILKHQLLKYTWSESKQSWTADPKYPDKLTRHPNILSVVSGLADKNQHDPISYFLVDNEVPPVGTPYMAGFECMALAQTGDIPYMLDKVKSYWGGMLSHGATTFWEAYDKHEDGKLQYAFYDRPYAKSLCHAWSAGPAAFLPSEVFGLRPIDDGWKRFTISPNMGWLDWASVSVPTKYGNITIDASKKSITVQVPSGTILEWKGESIPGPEVVRKDL